MDKNILNELRDAYLNNLLIPVVGSGLSLPFGLPDWATLLREAAVFFCISPSQQKSLNEHLNQYRYLEACNVLTKQACVGEYRLKEFVAMHMSTAKKAVNIDRIKSNYTDLAKMGKSRFLTTNYDEYLNDFVPNSQSFYLHQLKSIPTNTFTQRRFRGSIIPIHGEISRPESIVLSEESYRQLYDSEEFDPAFQVLRQHYTFLFLGFSFDDVYFKKLFHKVVGGFESRHFILFDEAKREQTEKIRELFQEYGVRSLFYGTSEGHAEGIHRILHDIVFFRDMDLPQDFIEADIFEELSTAESDELIAFRERADSYMEQEQVGLLRELCEGIWNRPDFGVLDEKLRREVLLRLMWCAGYVKDMEKSYEYMRYAESDAILSQNLEPMAIMFAQLQWNRRDWNSAAGYLERYMGHRTGQDAGLMKLLVEIMRLYQYFLPSRDDVEGEIKIYGTESRSDREKQNYRKEYVRFCKQYVDMSTKTLLEPKK